MRAVRGTCAYCRWNGVFCGSACSEAFGLDRKAHLIVLLMMASQSSSPNLEVNNYSFISVLAYQHARYPRILGDFWLGPVVMLVILGLFSEIPISGKLMSTGSCRRPKEGWTRMCP